VNFLLDTNVLSELHRPAPDLKVLRWLDVVDEDRVFISVASIAELRRGIALMDDGRRRAALAAWLANDLPRTLRTADPADRSRGCRALGRDASPLEAQAAGAIPSGPK
jgi:predicted nucleic acid-binding protein